MKRFLTIFVIALHLLIVDAITKEFAAHHLKGEPSVVVIDGFFDLTYVENRGCAWGMLQGQVWPLAVFAVLVMGLLIWRRNDFFFNKGPKWVCRTSAVAETLLYAGILGNLVDRVARGYVIDFFDFYIGESHFPCFNVADIAISCAAILLLVLSFAVPSEKKDD